LFTSCFGGKNSIQQQAAIQVTKSRSPRAKVAAPCIAIFLGSLSAAKTAIQASNNSGFSASGMSKWHPVEPGPKNQLTGLGKRT